MKQYLSISVIIPTLNNEKQIMELLVMLKAQEYPKNKIEILVCDGGSTDKTKEIAKKYHCKIIHNPKKLADYGVYFGTLKARTDLCIVMACDNKFRNRNALYLLAYPFLVNKNIAVSYPKQIYTLNDYWITKYTNTFTDPVNNFVYNFASNTRTFDRYYETKEVNRSYRIFDFRDKDYPMLALAQGTMFRNRLGRTAAGAGDDIGPIKEWIDRDYDFAYVPSVELEHHTTHSVGQFIAKMRWSFRNFFSSKSYGVTKRHKYFSIQRRIRILFWPFYAVSIVLPVVHALFNRITYQQVEWIYHPVLTYFSFYAFACEFISIKLLHKQVTKDRIT